jgi:hypothetical protein
MLTSTRLESPDFTDKSLQRSVHWADRRSDIVIAKLPDAVFNPFYADDNFSLNEKIKDEQINDLLDHYGWKRQETHYGSPATFTTLEHKYVTIYLESL